VQHHSQRHSSAAVMGDAEAKCEMQEDFRAQATSMLPFSPKISASDVWTH
jgi:hypothetical protein